MNVAVLTLTRDRLDYSKTCFRTLRENAGCDYDHFVVDQNSADGTGAWLLDQDDLDVCLLSENVGISRGLNLLLDEALNPADYDVIVKFDNDCELVQPDTLRQVCELVMETGWFLSPKIRGLNNPPRVLVKALFGNTWIQETAQIGGIFLAAPAPVFETFRFNEHAPPWGEDDSELCYWQRQRGGHVGYVQHLEAWHYESTNGQHAHYPEYFARTLAEGKPAL
jgi:GT2 family glycosyltransferase